MTAPDWLDRDSYPFTSRHFATPEGSLHYVDEGTGPTIVMVHGNPAWSFAYRHVIKALAPRFRCVAVDHLGFGLSDKPAGADLTPAAHARRLHDLIEGIGLHDIILMVQDWGGPIGISYAVRRPENVRGLVVLNTWMWPVNGDPHFERFSRFMGGSVGRFLIRRLNAFVNVVMPMAVADRRRSLPRHVLRQYRRALPDAASREACATFPRHILASGDWLAELWDARGRLSRHPVLIAWGRRDIAFRDRELARWRDAFPDADVTVFEDAGHYVQEEKGPEVAERVAAWHAGLARGPNEGPAGDQLPGLSRTGATPSQSP